MLPWVICECCAKLWSRRGLGQDRAHRVGKLMTRGDHPQLEQQFLVKNPQHKTGPPPASGHPHSCSEIRWNETSQGMQTKSQKTIGKKQRSFPCSHMDTSIRWHLYGICKEQKKPSVWRGTDRKFELWTKCLQHKS